MQPQRRQWFQAALAMAVVALGLIGVVAAQGPGDETKQPAAPKGKSTDGKKDKKEKAKGGQRVSGGAPPKKMRRGAGDPFAKPENRNNGQGAANLEPQWPFHYKFKIIGFDGTSLASAYYPSQKGTAPVVLLVHEKGRLGKDFEDEVEDLKGKGLAEYLQDQGYAVLIIDLRGHGGNVRRELGSRDPALMIRDLQAAYEFLVDRNNREELNLAKFAAVGIGEGANLVTAWAATPGGAVSSEGRTTDLGALVLISPVAEGFGVRLGPYLAAIAPRMPILLLAGERDNVSLNPVKEAQPIIARLRQSKAELLPTSLHGYKLLRFQPKVVDTIVAFFEATIKKVRAEEWEPRYNLTPVNYIDIEVVARKRGGEPAKKAAGKAEEKKADAKKEEPRKEAGKEEDAKKAAPKDEGKAAKAKAEATKKAP